MHPPVKSGINLLTFMHEGKEKFCSCTQIQEVFKWAGGKAHVVGVTTKVQSPVSHSPAAGIDSSF